MKWLNKVQLIGYLGKDPDIQILPTGFYFATLYVATNSGYTNENKKRITSWHRVRIWGKKPQYIRDLFIKGSHVMVDGQIVYKTFLDKDGKKCSVAEIKADKLLNLDR